MLEAVEWDLDLPTSLFFLRRYSRAGNADAEMHTASKYLLELAMHDCDSLRFLPSMLAASAAYLTRRLYERVPSWTETMKHYSGYSEEDLKTCASFLYALHSRKSREMNAEGHPTSVSWGTVVKYSTPTRYSVSGKLTPLRF